MLLTSPRLLTRFVIRRHGWRMLFKRVFILRYTTRQSIYQEWKDVDDTRFF